MLVWGSAAGRRRARQVGALLAITALPAMAQDAPSQIRAEIQRLQRSLKDQPLAMQGMPSANSDTERDLKSALDALDAGHLYVGLETLLRVEDFLQGARFAAERGAEIKKGGMPAFQATWDKQSLELTAFHREFQAASWSHAPAAVRALAEAAATRVTPLLEGGLGFATATGPQDGVFYLGEAQGEAQFARLCARLPLRRKGAPLPLRSLLPELESLQAKTNAAYQPPRSVELHPRFIALNSTLKMAQELDAAQLYAGALYEYLEATRHYGMLAMAPLADAGKAALKKDMAAARQKLDTAKDDNSVALIFLERAEAQTAHPDGSPASADEWRSARVIVDQVLPAYFAARKPASPLRQVAGNTVNITLVRWPYT